MQSHIVEKLDKLLPIEKLNDYAEKYKSEYGNAEPYPHIVLDNIFDEDILREVVEEFDVSTDKWRSFETKYEKKMQMNTDEEFGDLTRIFLHALNSNPFLMFLENMTGIKGLIPDMSYEGGGLHSIPVGGKLGVHVDFNIHKPMGVFRRLNVILYLNENWQESYGGAFEMWDKDRTEPKKQVYPLFNRLVIFSTTSSSYHGHPHPLTCPENVTRKSLALYYYTSQDRGDQLGTEHSTVWVTETGKTEELGKVNFVNKVINKLKRIFS